LTAHRTTVRLIGLFVLAPVLAVVIISALMLFGVRPQVVFLPGFFLKSRFHVPNVIGVLSSGFVWWLAVVAVWAAVHRVLSSKR
jgi:hypothetical protein